MLRKPRADLGRSGAERGDLRAVRLGPAFDRFADLLRSGVPLGAQAVGLALELAATRVGGKARASTSDGSSPLSIAPCGWRRGILAQPLQPDAHAAAAIRIRVMRGVCRRAAASRSRVTTNSGSSLASSQPARGPFGRPEEREVQRAEGPARLQPALGGGLEDRGLPRVAVVGRRAAGQLVRSLDERARGSAARADRARRRPTGSVGCTAILASSGA